MNETIQARLDALQDTINARLNTLHLRLLARLRVMARSTGQRTRTDRL